MKNSIFDKIIHSHFRIFLLESEPIVKMTISSPIQSTLSASSTIKPQTKAEAAMTANIAATVTSLSKNDNSLRTKNGDLTRNENGIVMADEDMSLITKSENPSTAINDDAYMKEIGEKRENEFMEKALEIVAEENVPWEERHASQLIQEVRQ